jgi:hypothetical protein
LKIRFQSEKTGLVEMATLRRSYRSAHEREEHLHLVAVVLVGELIGAAPTLTWYPRREHLVRAIEAALAQGGREPPRLDTPTGAST